MTEQKKRAAISALMTTSTVRQAAEKSGLSEKTIRNYLDDAEFRRELRDAAAERTNAISRQLTDISTEALTFLDIIIRSDEVPPTAKISAIRTALEYSLKFYELSDITRQIEELRDAIRPLQQ